MKISIAAGLALAAAVTAVPVGAQDYGYGHYRHHGAPRGYYGHGYVRPYGYARHGGYGYGHGGYGYGYGGYSYRPHGYGYGGGGGRFACRYRFGERRCYRGY